MVVIHSSEKFGKFIVYRERTVFDLGATTSLYHRDLIEYFVPGSGGDDGDDDNEDDDHNLV